MWWAGRILRWTHLAGVRKEKLREQRDRSKESKLMSLSLICQFRGLPMVLRFCMQLNFLFQLQMFAGSTAHNKASPLPVLLHCLPCLIAPISLCSFKLTSKSVLSRNMIGLTRLGYSKDSLVILCSLHFGLNLNFCSSYVVTEGRLWSQFWYNDPLLFHTLST